MANFVKRSGAFAVGTEAVQLFTEGSVTALTGTARWFPPSAITVESVTLRCGTAPTRTLTIAVNKSGTTATTVTLSSNQTKVVDTTAFDMTIDDYITVDVTAASGSDMSVIFNYTKK